MGAFFILILIGLPYLFIKAFKDGQDEFEEKKAKEWVENFNEWNKNVTLSEIEESKLCNQRHVYNLDELEKIKKELQASKGSPVLEECPSKYKAEMETNLLLANRGKIKRCNAFMYGGIKYHSSYGISYEDFLECLLWIDKRLKECGMMEPLFTQECISYGKYDPVKECKARKTIIYSYPVSKSIKHSLLSKNPTYIMFKWKPQLYDHELKNIVNYPY